MAQAQQSAEQKHQTSKPQRTPSTEGPAALQQAHPIQELQGKIGNAQIARMLGEEALWAPPEVGMEGGPVSNQLVGRIYQSLGGGHPLAHGTQKTLEATFGTPLDHVRIHDDAEADVLSLSVSASAFTLGSDIFFSHLADPSDEHLLRHEVAHVIQQAAMSTTGPLTVGNANDALEHEAQSIASTAVTPTPRTAAADPASAGQSATGATVQRGFLDELNLGNISGILGTGSSLLQGLGEAANLPLARAMGTTAPAITSGLPGGTALGGLTSVAGLYTGTRDMLDENKPWYERGVGGMSAVSGATGLASTVSSLFGSSLFAAGGSLGLTAGAGSALTGGGAGLLTGAGAATALGSLGAVLGAGAAGYGAGRLLYEGVGALGSAITGDSEGDYTISGGLASGMTSVDRAVSGLFADPDRPAYTQTLGWKLGEWLGI